MLSQTHYVCQFFRIFLLKLTFPFRSFVGSSYETYRRSCDAPKTHRGSSQTIRINKITCRRVSVCLKNLLLFFLCMCTLYKKEIESEIILPFFVFLKIYIQWISFFFFNKANKQNLKLKKFLRIESQTKAKISEKKHYRYK